MLQTSIYVTNYEQYKSIATATQQFGKSTFSLFRSKNSKFSANKSFLSKEKQTNPNDRKSNFHLVPQNNNSNGNNNDLNSKSKTKLSKYSTYLTASPSSLSYRLASTS